MSGTVDSRRATDKGADLRLKKMLALGVNLAAVVVLSGEAVAQTNSNFNNNTNNNTTTNTNSLTNTNNNLNANVNQNANVNSNRINIGGDRIVIFTPPRHIIPGGFHRHPIHRHFAAKH